MKFICVEGCSSAKYNVFGVSSLCLRLEKKIRKRRAIWKRLNKDQTLYCYEESFRYFEKKRWEKNFDASKMDLCIQVMLQVKRSGSGKDSKLTTDMAPCRAGQDMLDCRRVNFLKPEITSDEWRQLRGFPIICWLIKKNPTLWLPSMVTMVTIHGYYGYHPWLAANNVPLQQFETRQQIMCKVTTEKLPVIDIKLYAHGTRLISWRHVLFWCVCWYGLRSSRTCFHIDASDSLFCLTSTWTQTIPDASEKDVTSGNQTHAPKKRTGRVPCAYSLMQ